MTKLWNRSHWIVKMLAVSSLGLIALVVAERSGLWVPDSRTLAPPFDAKTCMLAKSEMDYPGVPLDSLSDDIQFQYRQECSQPGDG